MAASDLGPSRKGSPCIPGLEPGETVTLAEIDGPGVIQHIWITVTDRTSEQKPLYSPGSCAAYVLGRGRKPFCGKRWEIFSAAASACPIR